MRFGQDSRVSILPFNFHFLLVSILPFNFHFSFCLLISLLLPTLFYLPPGTNKFLPSFILCMVQSATKVNQQSRQYLIPLQSSSAQGHGFSLTPPRTHITNPTIFPKTTPPLLTFKFSFTKSPFPGIDPTTTSSTWAH